MGRRLKIKVVAGNSREAALPGVWEELAKTHHVEILSIDSGHGQISTALPVILFPQIPDMPGFFRDLEKHLLGADVIVGFETSKLYSFQALRAARKLGVPFVCVAHENTPFVYERYANIRAIQHDIHQNADWFFPTSRRAEELLRMEGVPDDKISRIGVALNPETFKFSETRARKFRNYIRLPDDSVLITMIASMDAQEPLSTMIQGIRLALNQASPTLRDKLRILICGDGEAAPELKYQVSDLGLGGRAMFLSQDVTPFLGDLLSATDILIEGRQPKRQEHEPLPWHVLSAAVNGVKLMIPAGSLCDDWLSGQMVTRMDDFSAMGVAMSLGGILRDFRVDFDARGAVAELSSESLSPVRLAAVFSARFEALCGYDERSARRQRLASFVQSYQVPVAYKEAPDVLLKCEEVREFSSTCEVDLYSEVLRIRGDALAAMARGDEAISAFEESLNVKNDNYHALRGLGYLAWHGHSHEDALSFFKRGLAVNPNDYQCLVGIGLVYRRLKMFGEAVFWLHRAIAVGGLESPSLSLFVQACLENAEVPEALVALNAVRESMGDHPNLVMAIEKLESHQ